VIVADLSSRELHSCLTRSGIRLRVGPIVAQIRSPFRRVESGIALHYSAHEVVAPDTFADFLVAVDPPASVRRWLGPQALFRFGHDAPFHPLPAAQAFPLLEWGLNWCVTAHCHQFLILHAAVVERGGRAALLPAPPGSGKSTLCAALVAHGWRLLSDELALIDLDSRRLVPFPRPISLKNQSIDAIARFSPGASMSEVVRDTQKGSVAHLQPPAGSVHASQTTALPAWIVAPTFRAGQRTALAPLPQSVTFMRLVDCAFNYHIHGRRGFDALGDLVAGSRCLDFSYGGNLDDAVRMFDQLEALQ
jgi:HprK-related kinase A